MHRFFSLISDITAMIIDLWKEERARNFQIVLSTGGGGAGGGCFRPGRRGGGQALGM